MLSGFFATHECQVTLVFPHISHAFPRWIRVQRILSIHLAKSLSFLIHSTNIYWVPLYARHCSGHQGSSKKKQDKPALMELTYLWRKQIDLGRKIHFLVAEFTFLNWLPRIWQNFKLGSHRFHGNHIVTRPGENSFHKNLKAGSPYNFLTRPRSYPHSPVSLTWLLPSDL